MGVAYLRHTQSCLDSSLLPVNQIFFPSKHQYQDSGGRGFHSARTASFVSMSTVLGSVKSFWVIQCIKQVKKVFSATLGLRSVFRYVHSQIIGGICG